MLLLFRCTITILVFSLILLLFMIVCMHLCMSLLLDDSEVERRGGAGGLRWGRSLGRPSRSDDSLGQIGFNNKSVRP